MDMTIFVTWLLVFALIYVVWRWHKNGTVIEELFGYIQLALRKGLGAADRETVQNIQKQLTQIQNQLALRLLPVATQCSPEDQSPEIQEEKGISIIPSEVEDSQLGALRYPSSAQFSLTWQGLRFTLSDWFWTHVGHTKASQITDEQLSSMIHGPFCPGCLKRWVGRVPDGQALIVPPVCPSCGISWNNGHFLYDSPPHVTELKRRVYEHFEQEIPRQTPDSIPTAPDGM